ncbi:hypothetical protein P4V43_18140 [Brevibacillus fortis]|uniref:hypothetical protein n=1 Tax=Brevibacillus fortis TaxID=2126352 RepID=UPI002E1CBB3A|nr:hypothetical protein [Brevibacillus fortis]
MEEYHKSSLRVLDFSGEDNPVSAAKAWAEAASDETNKRKQQFQGPCTIRFILLPP